MTASFRYDDARFQSTLPAGEATNADNAFIQQLTISIHASRGGSDPPLEVHKVSVREFQSTLPAGEATHGRGSLVFGEWNFNPRFPRGKRPSFQKARARSRIFQSTLPAGEATLPPIPSAPGRKISIHASRGGSDNCEPVSSIFVIISIHASRGGSDGNQSAAPPVITYFNPRFPRGKRLHSIMMDTEADEFQSTLPAGEATSLPLSSIKATTLFQSTLPAGEATPGEACSFP